MRQSPAKTKEQVARVVVFALSLVILVPVAFGEVRYVSPGGDDANAGTTVAPWRSIQHAVETAAPGDEIRVAAGTYAESVDIPASAVGLSVVGGFDDSWRPAPAGPGTVIAPGDETTDVVTIRSPKTSLSGLTLTEGKCGVTIRTPAQFQSGCGILLSRCRIVANASHGIDGGNAGKYGGLKFQVVAENCLVADNGGDGVLLFHGFNSGEKDKPDILANCTIANNAGNGVVSGNTGMIGTHPLHLTNCIIAGNGETGFLCYGAWATSHRLLSSCCLYANTICNLSVEWPSADKGDALGLGYIRPVRLLQGSFSADPLFVGGGDYRLRSGSPCLGTGASTGLATDLNGVARPAACDLGCFESEEGPVALLAESYADGTTGDDSNDGASPASAKKTINAALAITAAGGVCHAAAGTYREELLLPREGQSLLGAGAGATVIASRGDSALSLLAPGQLASGLTVGGSLRGVMVDDEAGEGARVDRCEISGNKLGIFGGASSRPAKALSITRCVITDNTRHAVYLFKPNDYHISHLRLVNSLVARNGGDGVFVQNKRSGDWAGTVDVISHCTIADNGRNGVMTGNPGVTGTTPLYMTNTIVARNGAVGFLCHGGPNTPHRILSACCLHGNGVSNLSNDWERADADEDSGNGYARIVHLLEGSFSADPLFIAEGDYRLGTGSPCIGAGVGAGVEEDLGGVARDAHPDLGCYEMAGLSSSFLEQTYVDGAAGDDANDGASPSSPKKTINAALALTAVGGVCEVAAGTYREEVLLPRAGQSLVGGGAGQTIVVSSGDSAVTFLAGGQLVRGLTLTGALRGVLVDDGAGAGARVEDCAITGNKFGVFGGSSSRPCGNVVLARCSVTDNKSHGIYLRKNRDYHVCGLKAEKSLVARNGGDGILLNKGDRASLILRCTIADNAGNGVVTGDLGTSNTEPVHLTNSIIAANGEVGFLCYGGANTPHRSLAACCLHGNTSGNFSNFWEKADIEESYNQGYTRIIHLLAGCFTADPLFAGGGDYRLRAGSPCIGAGVENGLAGDDGITAGKGACDLGCYDSGDDPAPRHAVTYADGTTGDDENDGTTPSSAKKTINAALAVTAPGGTCRVSAGSYREELLVPHENQTLQGAGSASTIVRGPGDSVVTLQAPGQQLRGLTLEGGLRGVFIDDEARSGLRLEDCTISGNKFGVFGGSSASESAPVVISRCVVTDNASHGVYMRAMSGWHVCAPAAENSLVARNGGDGFFVNGCDRNPLLLNCTVADNDGNGFIGAGLYPPESAITNCIFSGNGRAGVERIGTGSGAAFPTHVAYSCLYGNGSETADPLVVFGDGVIMGAAPAYKAGSYALTKSSPCLNAGIDTDRLLDLALRPRLSNGRTDIGAYEFASLGTVILLR